MMLLTSRTKLQLFTSNLVKRLEGITNFIPFVFFSVHFTLSKCFLLNFYCEVQNSVFSLF